jgi:glycosyltransferase involved in cell wall biosynthesis
MPPEITCIVISHNRARCLMEAMESIIHQTMPNWKCIVINNNSRDWTSFSMGTFQDKRISVYEYTTPGKAAALKFVQENIKITTPYVTVLDDDDILFPNAFEMRVAMLKETKADFVYSSYYALLSNNEMIFCPTKKFEYDSWVEKPYIGYGTWAFKKEFFLATSFNPNFVAALDYEWLSRATRVAKKIAYTPIPTYMYRKQPYSLSEREGGSLSKRLRADAQRAAELHKGTVKVECIKWIPKIRKK